MSPLSEANFLDINSERAQGRKGVPEGELYYIISRKNRFVNRNQNGDIDKNERNRKGILVKWQWGERGGEWRHKNAKPEWNMQKLSGADHSRQKTRKSRHGCWMKESEKNLHNGRKARSGKGAPPARDRPAGACPRPGGINNSKTKRKYFEHIEPLSYGGTRRGGLPEGEQGWTGSGSGPG